MTLAAEVIEKLAAPLDPTRVKKREGGGGKALSYIEGHDAIRVANEIFGVGNWTYFVTELTLLGEEPVVKTYNGQTREGFRVAYRAVVTVGSSGSGFSDVGFGDSVDYTGSKLTPHELASKEAVTDALKRALKNFGDQFGLCLYDKDAPEHNGHNGSTAASAAGNDGGRGAETAFAGPPAPPNNLISGEGGDWTFPSGKHQGVALKDVPVDYLTWYQNNGPKADVKQRIAQFLTPEGGSISDAEPPDDDIPFQATI